jgi:hypothetical protein
VATRSVSDQIRGPGRSPAPTPPSLGRQLWLVASIKTKTGLRAFGHDIRTRIEGKLAVLVALTLPIMGKSLIQQSFEFPRTASTDGAVGVVAIGVLLSVVTIMMGSVAMGIKTLAIARRDEALKAFPAFKSLTAATHMALQTVGLTTVFLGAWFALMYAPTAYALHPNHLSGVIFVLVTFIALCAAAGIEAYLHMLRWIEARPSWTPALHVVFGFFWVISFAILPIFPKATYEYWPERIEALGSALASPSLGMPTRLALLSLVLLAVVWRARRKVIEAVQSPSPVIWNGVPVLPKDRFKSSFSALVRQAEKAPLWRLFLAKDVFLPRSRRPSLLFLEFLLTVSIVATGASLAFLSHKQNPLQAEILSEMTLVAASLVVLGAVSLFRGVGCVGVEAPMLRILRSSVGARSLWRLKLLSAFTAMVPHMVVVGIFLTLGMMVWGNESNLAYDLVILGGAATAFPLTGVAAGFLFPKIDAVQSGILPGSSMTGKAVAIVLMAYFSGVSVALLWLNHSAGDLGGMLPLTVVISTGALSGVALLMTMFGVRRLKGLEL